VDAVYVLFCVLLALVAVLASIAVWSPRATRLRAVAVALVAGFVPLGYLTLTEVLSQPKPMTHEWFKGSVDEATVLSVSFDEGNAIYLWLQFDDPEPRYYRLPWRPVLAQKLQNYVDEAIRKGARVMIRNPFSKRSFDDLGDLNVEIILPPPLPGKLPPVPPRVVNPSERSA
jgi:hypothetical protein